MRIAQVDLSARPHAELVLQNNGAGISLSDRACESLGDHAAVKTGFYSGNDRRWIRKRNGVVPRAKSFLEVTSAEIAEETPSLQGIAGKRKYIPMVRGGAAAFVKPTQWYVDWSVDAVNEYRRKGTNPARFQNSAFYFGDGIAVPMVASGRITGALLESRLFDQGIVGVFPHDPRLLMYFLGFFNSTIATDLVRQVNPTANNSANYLKRLPIVLPYPEELSTIDRLVHQAIDQVRQGGAVTDSLQREIDSIYSRLWYGETRCLAFQNSELAECDAELGENSTLANCEVSAPCLQSALACVPSSNYDRVEIGERGNEPALTRKDQP